MLSRFTQSLVAFLKAEDGPTSVEYAVQLALILVVCLNVITSLAGNANKTFTKVSTAVNTAS